MGKPLSAAEFQELHGNKKPAPKDGPALSREQIQALTLNKKKAHKKLTLSAEEACKSMGHYFELDPVKVNFFVRQLQITGKMALIAIILSSCRPSLKNYNRHYEKQKATIDSVRLITPKNP